MQALREPLPDGWEARLTPSGQIYYANHVARRTQWTRPVAPAAKQTAATQERERLDYDRRSLLSQVVTSNNDPELEEEGYGFGDESDREGLCSHLRAPLRTPPPPHTRHHQLVLIPYCLWVV